MTAFLTAIGRRADEVSMGFGSVSVDDEFATVTAFRAPGVPLPQLLAALTALAQQEMEDEIADAPIQVATASVAGKQVTVVQVQDAFEEDDRTYVYGVGEVAFFVEAPPVAAERIFADLP